jgi:hypothetical protein
MLAQGLPVTLVPEQSLVAAMRHDVIYDTCGHMPANVFAHHAPGMLAQECGTRLVPARVVAALPERAAVPVVVTLSLSGRARM